MKNIKLKWVLLLLLIFVPRLLWMSDMEFKADEEVGVETVRQVWQNLSLLAPKSGHSGIAHSGLLFFWISIVSFGTSDPYWMGIGVVMFNIIGLLIPLYLLRKNPPWLLFALWAAHPTLVFGSRKIWAPDLLPGWMILGLGLYWVYRQKIHSGLSQKLIGFFSSFSLAIAGHMYLSGVIEGWLPALVLLVFLYSKDRKQFKPFFAGLIAAGLTYLPYAYVLLTQAPEQAPGNLNVYSDRSIAVFVEYVRHIFLAPSPFGFWRLYLRPIQEIEMASPFMALFLLSTVLIWIAIIGVLGLWLYAIFRKKTRALALDERWMTAVISVIGTAIALFMIRLGGHLHYWLGVIPVLIFGIASRMEVPQGRLKNWAWGTVVACVLAVFSFQLLVHVQGGLPGEYGPAYSTK